MLRSRTLALLAVMMMLLSTLAVAQEHPDAFPDAPPMVGQGPPGGPGGGPPGGPDGPGPGGPDGPHMGLPPSGQRGAQGKRLSPVSAEMEAKFLAFIKENDPSSLDDLQKLKSNNPTQYKRVVAEGVMRMRFMEMLKKNDPTAYQSVLAEFKLEGSVRRLAESYRSADANKKPSIKEQLRQALNQLFDAREANQKGQVARLEKQLATMKARLQERQKNKTTIVNRRLEDMTSDPSTSW